MRKWILLPDGRIKVEIKELELERKEEKISLLDIVCFVVVLLGIGTCLIFG